MLGRLVCIYMELWLNESVRGSSIRFAIPVGNAHGPGRPNEAFIHYYEETTNWNVVSTRDIEK